MKRLSIAFLVFIAFLVAIPFLSAPYLLLLDKTSRIDAVNILPTTKIYGLVPYDYGNNLLYSAILIPTSVISTSIGEKLFLFLILALSGISMYYLVPVKSESAKVFAALLYMVNPFTYARIMFGHWPLVLAYALTPIGIRFLLDLIEKPNLKNTAKLAIITTMIAISAHQLLLIVIVYASILFFYILKKRNYAVIKYAALAMFLVLLTNSYWIYSTVSMKTSAIDTINDEHLKAYSAYSKDMPVEIAVLTMHGMWRQGYDYTKDVFSLWGIVFLMIFTLFLIGVYDRLRAKDNWITYGLLVSFIFAFIFGTGMNGIFSGINGWLSNILPILNGLRDTHKTVAILCLCYAYFGAFGIEVLEKKIKRKWLLTAVVLIPLIYSYGMFGFLSQIHSTDYPQDWYQIENIIKNNNDTYILSLPWHQYPKWNWIPIKDSITGNPVTVFFSKPAISSGRSEMINITTPEFTDKRLFYVEEILDHKTKLNNMGIYLKPLNVEYVLLGKERNWEEDMFLPGQEDLELVILTDNFYVFRNKVSVSKIYGTNDDCIIKELKFEEYPNCFEKLEPITYEKVNPSEYVITENQYRYLVLSEIDTGQWEFNGKPAKTNKIGMIIFETNGNEGNIVNKVFNNLIPFYILSGFGAIISIVLLTKK